MSQPAPHQSRRRSRLWLRLALVALCACVLVAAIPAARNFILRAAGHALVGPQPHLESADVIVVAIDAGGAGTLEAADLVKAGVSSRVAIFHDPPSAADREFLRRGVPYEDRAAISEDQLRMLGVRNIVAIPRSTTGSSEEGQILPDWCRKQGFHSVLLVTSTDHSRRLTRILRRTLRGSSLAVTVVSSRYSNFNPDSWWQSRYGTRMEIIEGQKLLLDVLRHPFS
jgi:uncharacterized SAM-binding protein YcdF (DUF218 family)